MYYDSLKLKTVKPQFKTYVHFFSSLKPEGCRLFSFNIMFLQNNTIKQGMKLAFFQELLKVANSKKVVNRFFNYKMKMMLADSIACFRNIQSLSK